MNLDVQSARRGKWLGLLALMLAIALWMPEQLWSNRRLLFLLGLCGAVLATLLVAWCLYQLRRLAVQSTRSIYLAATFWATQGLVGPALEPPCRLPRGRTSDRGR
jgi:hypothetical protein